MYIRVLVGFRYVEKLSMTWGVNRFLPQSKTGRSRFRYYLAEN